MPGIGGAKNEDNVHHDINLDWMCMQCHFL